MPTVVPPGLANIHRERNTLTGESNLCCWFVWSICTSSNWQGIHAPHPRRLLGAPILTLARISLYYLESLAVPHSLHMHTRAALLLHTEMISPSIATMTSGSIDASSIDTSHLGTYREEGK